jgi:PLP dependent protein
MPPLQNNPEENRIYFKKCCDFGKKLNLYEFSMGTSHDYSVALEEGSTWIRLGTILFGERILK